MAWPSVRQKNHITVNSVAEASVCPPLTWELRSKDLRSLTFRWDKWESRVLHWTPKCLHGVKFQFSQNYSGHLLGHRL